MEGEWGLILAWVIPVYFLGAIWSELTKIRKEIYAVERNTRRFNIDFKMTEEDYK